MSQISAERVGRIQRSMKHPVMIRATADAIYWLEYASDHDFRKFKGKLPWSWISYDPEEWHALYREESERRLLLRTAASPNTLLRPARGSFGKIVSLLRPVFRKVNGRTLANTSVKGPTVETGEME